jgi:hypothetical protein
MNPSKNTPGRARVAVCPARQRVCVLAAGAWLAAACAPASAHDTWFQRLSPHGAATPPLLALGTGNLYPEHETGVGAEYLRQPGCHTPTATAASSALTPVHNAKRALLLRAPAGAQGCWAQLTPFDIELPADKVAPYLDEMNASAALRSTWAAMQARGVAWQERYTKHARIELGPGGAETPVPMGMDALLLRRNGQLVFTLLRDGQPLPGLAVELRSATPVAGRWHRTDEQGRLQLPEPAAGRWLLRAIDLRPSSTRPDQWESRFLTLAFDGGAAAAGRGVEPPLQQR